MVFVFHLFVSSFKFKSAKTVFSILVGILTMSLLSVQYFMKIPRYEFYLFVSVFPIQIITIQKFNATLNYYFPRGQSVRFYEFLQNSREFGFIIIGYIIPLLLFFKIKDQYFLFVCLGSYFLMLFSELIFVGKSGNIEHKKENQSLRFFKVIANNYSRQIIFFLVLSSLIGYLIHYAFIVIANQNFKSSEGLIKFFGVFMSTMMLFMYLADRYLLKRILNNLGLPYSIVLSPIFTGIFIVLASIIGWKFGYGSTFTGYTFFFMFFAAGKYIENLFKYAVETPSSNILVASIKSMDRDSLKEFIQGPVVAFGLLSAGVIVYAKSYFIEFNLLYLSILIVVLSTLWFFVSVNLIKRYRRNLKLRFAEVGIENNITDYLALPEKNENIIFKHFNESNDEKSLYVLKLLKSLAPLSYFKYLLNYLNPHRKNVILTYVLSEIERYNLTQALPVLYDFKIHKNEEMMQMIQDIMQYLDSAIDDQITYDKIVDTIFSSNLKEKKQIVRLISERNDEDIEKLLPILLKDIEPEIVFLSMVLAKNLKIENCLEIIAGHLLNDLHYALAYEVLISFGETAVPFVEELYYSDDIEQKTMIRLIRLMGDIPSEKSLQCLFDKLDEVDFRIKKEVIQSLRKHNFKSSNEDQFNVIVRQIVRAVENCTWNMAVQLRMRRIENNDLIIEALDNEIKENYVYIFGLLTLLYDHKKLNYIYNQILLGNSEILAYAIELLDFILDEDLKNIIFPLFENSTYQVKISQLQYYFPVELSSKEENLKKIINRESNLLSSWTKACAIYFCGSSRCKRMIDDLVSCMFHPVQIIRETASYVLFKKHPDLYKSAYKRLPENYRAEQEISIEYAKLSENHLIFNRILYLKNFFLVFNDVPDEQMVKFVSLFEHLYLEKDDQLYISEEDQASMIWVFEGKIQVRTKISVMYRYEQNSIVDLNVIPLIQNVVAKESSMLYILKRNHLNELLFGNKELLTAYLKMMNEDKTFHNEDMKSHYEKVLI